MNTIIVIFSVVAIVAADGVFDGLLGRPRSSGLVEFNEDTAGNYNLKYNTDSSSRNEQRFRDGRVLGSYSFVDPDGKSHTVTYVAGENQGFVANGASIPVNNHPAPLPVQETPEVLRNRAEHLALLQKERSLRPLHARNFEFVDTPVSVDEVLAKLTPPQIPNLPSEDQESQQVKAALRAAYQESLEKLANEYRRS